MVIKVSVKETNETIGENGLVPVKITFGGLHISNYQHRPTSPKKGAEVPKSAWAEMNTIVAVRRVQIGLNRSLSPTEDRKYSLGEKALLYSEKEK